LLFIKIIIEEEWFLFDLAKEFSWKVKRSNSDFKIELILLINIKIILKGILFIALKKLNSLIFSYSFIEND
jgi:hypothetical protein